MPTPTIPMMKSRCVRGANPESRAHSCAATTITAKAATPQPRGGSRKSAATTSAMRTSAVTRRVLNIVRGNPEATTQSSLARSLHLLARAAEASLALAIGRNRRVERDGIEVGPQEIREVEFRVRKLPKQEIGDPLLAAGADEKVGFGRVIQCKVRLQRLRRNRRSSRAVRVRREESLRCLCDIPASAIVCGDGQRQARIVGRHRLACSDELTDAR